MKKAVIVLTTIIFGCQTPSKEKVEPNKKRVTKEVNIDKKSNILPNLLSLRKKECSGDCPVFEAILKEDHTLVFKGEKHTAAEGTHIIKLAPEKYQKIVEALDNSGFASLQNQYFDERSKDFSETIITYNHKSVSVKLWKDAPEKLTAIYVLLEDILYDNKFLE